MDLKITSQGSTYTCAECKNESTLTGEAGIGDVIECEFCGIEYEIASNDENGNYTLVMIEEEK